MELTTYVGEVVNKLVVPSLVFCAKNSAVRTVEICIVWPELNVVPLPRFLCQY
jgi:hypothetical protein